MKSLLSVRGRRAGRHWCRHHGRAKLITRAPCNHRVPTETGRSGVRFGLDTGRPTMTTTTVPRSSAAETRRAIWNTIRGSLGNLVEWYDVYVYTVFATYFEGQFFDESEKNSTVYVYAIFAIT